MTEETQLLPNHQFAQCPNCQARILIVPDLAAMARAIKNHAAMHSNPDEVDQILSERTMTTLIYDRKR